MECGKIIPSKRNLMIYLQRPAEKSAGFLLDFLTRNDIIIKGVLFNFWSKKHGKTNEN